MILEAITFGLSFGFALAGSLIPILIVAYGFYLLIDSFDKKD